MTSQVGKIITGTRGPATWEDGEAMGALNLIDGAHLLAIRSSDRPEDGKVITLNGQCWTVVGEVIATVAGMRVLRVRQASNAVD